MKRLIEPDIQLIGVALMMRSELVVQFIAVNTGMVPVAHIEVPFRQVPMVLAFVNLDQLASDLKNGFTLTVDKSLVEVKAWVRDWEKNR